MADEQNKGGRPVDPRTADGYLIEILKDVQKITRLSRQKIEKTAAQIDKRQKTMEGQNALGLSDMLDVLAAYSKIPASTGNMIAPLAKIINDLRTPSGSSDSKESAVDAWKMELVGDED